MNNMKFVVPREKVLSDKYEFTEVTRKKVIPGSPTKVSHNGKVYWSLTEASAEEQKNRKSIKILCDQKKDGWKYL